MKVTPEERRAGSLSPEALAKAAHSLREAGYVVLEDVFDPEWVTRMRTAASELIGAKRLGGKRTPNPQANVPAPRGRPFDDPLAHQNPLAVQVLSQVLGPKILRTEYWIKARLPGGGPDQQVHRDGRLLFPELPYALPAWTTAVSIALSDFSAESGATEIWPGSHLTVDAGDDDRRATEERASRWPSTRLSMPAGSLALRDPRAWHRGASNRTHSMRLMLDLHYVRDLGGVAWARAVAVLAAEDRVARRRERAPRRPAGRGPSPR